MESNYVVCPHCHGQGVVRTVESGAVLVLRGIEEEGIKNRSSQLNVFVPTDVAIYLLNQKRQNMVELEQKYKMSVIVSADDSIQNINDYRIERIKAPKVQPQEKKAADEAFSEPEQTIEPQEDVVINEPETDNLNAMPEEENNSNGRRNRRDRNMRGRRERGRRGRPARNRRDDNEAAQISDNAPVKKEKQEPVILYNSHGTTAPNPQETPAAQEQAPKEKSTWWKKLIKG